MSRTIQMKRGLLADLPQLLPGEFAFTIDTHEVFIGSAEGNVPMVNSDKIRELELDYETAAAALELTYAPELANLKASDTSINAQIAAFNQTIAAMNRGLGETMSSMAQLLSTYPTGDTKDHLVAGNIAEVDTLTVTTIPTTAGAVKVTLNGVAKTVPVTVGRAEVASLLVTAVPATAGNVTVTLNGITQTVSINPAVETTTNLVAAKIRGTFFSGWVLSGTGSTVVFTSTTTGTKTDAVYSAGTTGATGTMSTTTQGIAEATTTIVAAAILAATFTGWTTGGTGSVVTFTATEAGTRTAPTFSGGTTGAAATFARTVKGEEANYHRYFWNGTAWTDGGVDFFTQEYTEAIEAQVLADFTAAENARQADYAAAEAIRQAGYLQASDAAAANQELYEGLLEEGVLQTSINTKLAALELEYAPELTTLQQNDVTLSQQLAETESELLNRNTDVTKMGIERNVDITTELTQLFANANDGDSFFFPKGEYQIGSLTVDKDINLYSDEATITSIDGTEKYITINSKVCIEGFKFNKVGLYFPYTYEHFSNIRKNSFSNLNGIGAIFGETGFNKTPKNVSFTGNQFDNNTYSFKGGFSYCLFENNIMNNGSGNRNIEINMGQHNTIVNNKIKTGVTGVSFLIDAALTKQIPITGNLVKGNDIQGISEEGISFDVFGNNAEKCGTILSANVLTRLDSGNFQITLDKEFSAFIFINCFLVFLDGVRKGEIFKINDMPYGGSSVLQLENKGGSWEVVGSKVSIIIPFLFNEVSGNTLTDCELAGIVLYGNCIGNIVEKNNLRNSNIQSTKLGGLLGDRPAVSMYNQIRNNNIIDGEIIMDYINYGGVPSPKGYKNEVSGNNFYNSILRVVEDSEELMVQESNRLINSIEMSTF